MTAPEEHQNENGSRPQGVSDLFDLLVQFAREKGIIEKKNLRQLGEGMTAKEGKEV
jgi:hypothetical protein